MKHYYVHVPGWVHGMSAYGGNEKMHAQNSVKIRDLVAYQKGQNSGLHKGSPSKKNHKVC
jgi:hypothetical protein